MLYPTELLAHSDKLERVTGIEPASPAWKAGALTIVLHLRLPSVEIVSLDILTYIGMHVKQFSYNFLQFYCYYLKAEYRERPCGRSSMVEHQPSKLDTWVRFPSPAPNPFGQVGLNMRQ